MRPMHPRRLVYLAGPLIVLMLLGVSLTAANKLLSREVSLRANGRAYEVRTGPDGDLWLSDFGSREIWQLTEVQPGTVVYTTYFFGSSSLPSDAQPGPDGDIWWCDTFRDAIFQMTPGQKEATLWPLPIYLDDAIPYNNRDGCGIAFDDQGRVWAPGGDRPRLYRLDPVQSQICGYRTPGGNIPGGTYVAYAGGRVWAASGNAFTDVQPGHILRLNPGGSQGSFTTWALDSGAYPVGLAVDGSGDIWWADPDLNQLGRLAPGSPSGQLTLYTVPTYSVVLTSTPEMVLAHNGFIYFAETSGGRDGEDVGRIGLLNPEVASGVSRAAAAVSASDSLSCTQVITESIFTVQIRGGVQEWQARLLPESHVAPGWELYDLPAPGWPFGLAAHGGQLYVADQGRQRLMNVNRLTEELFLPIVLRP